MKDPNLVDYEKIFERKTKKIIKVVEYPKIDYLKIMINFGSVFILLLGIYILHRRSENKQINKMLYDKKVFDISNEINETLNNSNGRED